MKNRLFLVFGIMTFWSTCYAQVPEYLYYQFDDSTVVFNFASNPQGNQNIPVPSNLFIDTVGFQASNSLSGNTGPAAGGINSNFYPDYSKDFTVSFWYQNTMPLTTETCFYLFGDSAADFHCVATINNGTGFVTVYGRGGLSLNIALLPVASLGSMFHIVYDATPTLVGPYGSYTMYSNGFSLVGTLPITSPPFNNSSGLSIGSAPISTNAITTSPSCSEFAEDMGGNLDEFRWYDRALTAAEVGNTFLTDVTALGACTSYTNFTIDSISGEAATVRWVPGIANTSFSLEYGPAGFSKGSGTTVSGTYPSSQPVVYLNNLTADSEYDVYFREYCNSSPDSVYNPKPLTFKTTPLCPTPKGIEILSINADSILVNWSHPGPVQEFYITYGLSGFDPLTSGTTDTVSSLPHKIGGVNSGTYYDFYVMTGCGGTFGNSIQVQREIATECQVIAAPYFEDFEGSTWLPEINICWSMDEKRLNNVWRVYNGNSSGRGAITGHNGSVKYLGSPELSRAGQVSDIYSPHIDISGLSAPYLSFYYHRYHADGNNHGYNIKIVAPQPDFWLEVNDGTGWVRVLTLRGGEQLSASDPYKKAGVNLSGFGDTIQVRITTQSVTNGFSSVMSLDDFSVDEAPACPDFFDISSFIFGADTSIVAHVNTYASSWELEWGPTGFLQGTGSCINTFSGTYLLDDCILINQNVDIYVKDCQSATFSGPYEICGPYTAPYFTDFSDHDPTMTRAACWDIYSSGNAASGDLVHIDNLGVNPYSGTNALRLFNVVEENEDSLMAISPAFIDLPQGNKQVRFMANVALGNAQGPNLLIIGTMASPQAGNTFSPIDTVNLTTQWKEYVVHFDVGSGSQYNGTDNRIALKLGAGISQVYVDDFNYEEIPTCPAPLRESLGIENEWYDAVTGTWEKYSHGHSIITWGSPGFVPGDVNTLGKSATLNTRYRMSGLTPNTTYEFYVRDSCTATDKSDWIGPYAFTTLCTPFAAPFLENFDGGNWRSAPLTIMTFLGPQPNRVNLFDTIDGCWKRNAETGAPTNSGLSGDTYHTWGVISESVYKRFTVTETGPLQDHSGSGNFVFPVPYARKSIGNNIPDTADLYLPLIDISSLSRPYLSYYYHRFTVENYMPKLFVQVSNGTEWITIDSLKGISHTAASDPFFQRGVSLSGLPDTLHLRFRSLYVGAPATPQGHIINLERSISALDEIEIKEAPPCTVPVPYNAYHEFDTILNSWHTYLTWENLNASISGYELAIGAPGANPDSLVSIGSAFQLTGDSLLLDTLQPGCYEFFVRTICDSGDTSSFSNPTRFCIPCTPLPAPLLETFDYTGPLAMPSCWNRRFKGNSPTLSYNWLLDTASNLGFTGPAQDFYGFGQYTYLECRGSNGDTAELYSPLIDISQLSKPEVSFAYHMFGADIGTLHMDISDGFTWYADVCTLTGQKQLAQADSWLDTIIKLDPYRSTGFIQVRFWSERIGASGRIAVDNFRISDTLSCPFPENFRMTQNTDSTATLAWDGGVNTTDFVLEYGLRGYVYGTGTRLVTSSGSITIPVADNRLYAAYLKSNCGGGDSSLIIGPVYFQSRVVPCDDFEAYALGSIVGKSSLIKSWDAFPGTYFTYRGNAEYSDVQALSGTQSLHLFETPTSGSGLLAHFDQISSGMYAVNFSYRIEDLGGGFYSFVTSLGPNGAPLGATPVLFHLNQVNMQLDLRNRQGSVLGSTSYNTGWNDLSHIIDFVNDTAWIISNGQNAGLGWRYTDPLRPQLSLEGIQFLTTPVNINFTGQGSEFFVDDFCIEPYQCPAPTALVLDKAGCTQAAISWDEGQSGSRVIIEYGPPGFTLGTGTQKNTLLSADTLTGLSPATTYEVYVGESCGHDTLYTGPLSLSTLSSAIADFSFVLGAPGVQSLTVSFDGSPSTGAQAYNWLFDNTDTATGQMATYTFTANGSYLVQLVITSDCGNDTVTKTITITGIGLEENVLDRSLEMRPNPFQDEVQISFTTASSEQVTLHINDLSGRLVMQKVLLNTNGKYEGTLDLTHLARGTYLVKVESGALSTVRSLIKN